MVLPLTYGCSAAKISPEFALVSLLAGYWHSWSSSVFVNWTIWPGHYREEKCDVMLPWLQKFWTSRIFLDRDGHLHCPTMEEKYGLSFCPWVQCTGNSYVSIFSSFFFCHSLLRSTENFDTMVTWRIFVSSLLTKLRPFFFRVSGIHVKLSHRRFSRLATSLLASCVFEAKKECSLYSEARP